MLAPLAVRFVHPPPHIDAGAEVTVGNGFTVNKIATDVEEPHAFVTTA